MLSYSPPVFAPLHRAPSASSWTSSVLSNNCSPLQTSPQHITEETSSCFPITCWHTNLCESPRTRTCSQASEEPCRSGEAARWWSALLVQVIKRLQDDVDMLHTLSKVNPRSCFNDNLPRDSSDRRGASYIRLWCHHIESYNTITIIYNEYNT